MAGAALLSIAAREADIVGINGSLAAGVVGPEAIATMTGEAVVERLAIVREAAGERIDDIELNIRAFFVERHRRPGRARSASVAGFLGVDESMVADSPFALVGSTAGIAEELVRRREELGFSYVIVGGDDIDAFAPVVAQLRLGPDRSSRLCSPARECGRTRSDRRARPITLRSGGWHRSAVWAVLLDDGDAVVADGEPLAVLDRVEADPVPLGDVDVLVDDAAVQPGAGADPHAREQDRVGDVGVVVDVHTRCDDRALDVGAGDDRALAQQAAVDVRRLAARAPGHLRRRLGPRWVYTGQRSL